MSSNLSIGSSYSSAPTTSVSTERVVSEAPTPAAPSNSDYAIAQIQSVKELKQYELKSEPVSIGEEEMIKAIERANKVLNGVTTTCEFSIHDKTKQIMVKVLEKETGRVIREIPSEKILDMVANMIERAGLWVDERR